MSNFKIRRTHFPDKILLVSADVRTERLNTCEQCPFYKENHCSINDKFMPTFVNARASHCPLGVWSSHYGR